jgi:transcriptional regulator with PAS, ATPase and Fis domain
VTARELARTRDARETRFAYDEIVGTSEAVRALLKLVDRVTTSDVPVLILGESGSGKELVARAIHGNGSRAQAPFVSENCSAIPEGLLESTLFGHVRGAFTGAARPRAGLFEVAHHGTLFLDEIADMSLGMQTKLLRVLQDGAVRPVGSETEKRVDVRVVAATHRDLAAMVKTRAFREDLYYRLNIVALRIPSLRARSEPSGRTRPSSSTRSSFVCIASDISPISSRNSVPPSAASKSPARGRSAPVNAPRTWPNSADSSRLSGIAPQFSPTNGRDARAP